MTAADGSYSLPLTPGVQYIIVEQVATSPAGSRAPTTTRRWSTRSIRSTASSATWSRWTAAKSESGNDFGNYQNATKTGRKYNDLNADGDDEGGSDPGLSGWTIAAFADNDSSGTLSAGDTLSDSDVTDGQRRLQPDAQARCAVHHRRAGLRPARAGSRAPTTTPSRSTRSMRPTASSATWSRSTQRPDRKRQRLRQLPARATKTAASTTTSTATATMRAAAIRAWRAGRSRPLPTTTTSGMLSAGDTLADSDVTGGRRRLQPDAHAGSAVHHRRADLRPARLVREPRRRHDARSTRFNADYGRVRLRGHAELAARSKAATTSATAANGPASTSRRPPTVRPTPTRPLPTTTTRTPKTVPACRS